MIEFAQNKVEMTGAEIWRNRSFTEWHGKTMVSKPGWHCLNGNCPHKSHGLDMTGYYDPGTESLAPQLQSGERLLVQDDYCDNLGVNYATLDQVRTWRDGTRILDFQEKSSDVYRLKPTESNRHGFEVFWSSARYIARPDNQDATPFGKYGGRPLFTRELANLTGASMREVNEAMRELDAINDVSQIETKLKLDGFFNEGRAMQLLEEGNKEEFVQWYRYLQRKQPDIRARLVGVLTQQGRLEELIALIPDWRGPNPEAVNECLDQFGKWYLYNDPAATEQVASWHEQWNAI